jgi:hypothetical protein
MKIEAFRNVSIGPAFDSISIHHRRVREISIESSPVHSVQNCGQRIGVMRLQF